MNAGSVDLFSMGQELLWLATVLPTAAQQDWRPYYTTGRPWRQQVREALPNIRQLGQLDPSVAPMLGAMLQVMQPYAEYQVAFFVIHMDERSR